MCLLGHTHTQKDLKIEGELGGGGRLGWEGGQEGNGSERDQGTLNNVRKLLSEIHYYVYYYILIKIFYQK